MQLVSWAHNRVMCFINVYVYMSGVYLYLYLYRYLYLYIYIYIYIYMCSSGTDNHRSQLITFPFPNFNDATVEV